MADIEITREELALELLALQNEITAGQVEPDIISLAAFAISKFDEAVSAEVSEGLIDEDQAIGFEGFRKEVADAIHVAAQARLGNTQHVNLLNRHKDTPRANAKREAQKIAQDAERKVNADRVLEEIRTVEAKHTVSSLTLRQQRYQDPTVEPHERSGTWLAHKLEEIVHNGSELALFTAQEAKIVAGNALKQKTYADTIRLKRDLEHLAKLHERAKFLGAHAEPGLFSGVSKLHELAETDVLERRSDLKTLRSFIELLETPSEDLFERVVSALNEGPFASCPELDVIPFPPATEEREGRSVKEIPSDEATQDKILDDIQRAVKASGATEYIVEEERVTQFVSLKDHLEHNYPGQVKIYRSLKSNWHPLPWYVIEVEQPNHPPLAVLESPLYGNATYYINNGDWQGTINFRRRDAQQLGAQPIIHALAEGQTLVMHTNRIKTVVAAGYKS